MDHLYNTCVLEPINYNTLSQIIVGLELNQEIILKDIEVLLEWQGTQPHFPDKLSRQVTMAFLVISKGSIEVAKQKIDNYFSIRSRFQDILDNYHPKSLRMINFQKQMDIVLVPKLNRGLTRVMIFKMNQHDEMFDFNASFCALLNMVDVRLHEEASLGDHVIYDAANVKIHHLATMQPMMVKKFLAISEKTFKLSIKGFHVLNAPSYVSNFMMMIKPLLKDKIIDRVIFHNSLDTLHEEIDRNILPKEYGGSNYTMKELVDSLQKGYTHYAEFYDRRETWRVNEDLRPQKIDNDDFYGYQGNFKKLDVD